MRNRTTEFLETLQPYLQDCEKNLEFSWTLQPGLIQKKGRLCCWLPGTENLSSVSYIIAALGAPAAIRHALTFIENPQVTSIGISTEKEGHVYRLYLHGKTRT